MSSSGSDYKLRYSSRESSIDADRKPKATSSRRSSVAPISPRKRRRSLSTASDWTGAKRHLRGHYTDDYRLLFNKDVYEAAARFNVDDSLKPPEAQIGISKWSVKEKSTFFAALERLGKDDIPGISAAVRTKSIPQVREFALLLQDTATERKPTKITLRDIPAAIEITSECCDQLEQAGDAMSWYQERFEAKQEEERFGKYWLITPEIAEEIDDAHDSSSWLSVSSSPPPNLGDESDNNPSTSRSEAPQILQNVPESNLLVPSSLLRLSSSLFMNGSSEWPSWYPHWTTLVSPLASEPSIYRTALIDFHTLVLSLTKRLIQASIIQATSRLRSQGWRVKHAASPLIKKRDVLAAVDMLRLQRNAKERWRGVARRCGLRVFDGVGKIKKQLGWKEVEDILGRPGRLSDPRSTDGEAPDPTLGAEIEGFTSKAIRSGTLLPQNGFGHVDSGDGIELDREYDEEHSDTDASQSDELSMLSSDSARSSPETDVPELATLEDFDNKASQEAEVQLWAALGTSPPPAKEDHVELRDKEDELSFEDTDERLQVDNVWRDWTDYHAEWEDRLAPVPPAMFRENRKEPSDMYAVASKYESRQLSDAERLRGRRTKRRKPTESEVPFGGSAQAFAALQVRNPEAPTETLPNSDDDAKYAADAIEDADTATTATDSTSEDEMDLDAKPSIEH